MAEAIAAIGVVASVIQLVDFSSKVLHRLEQFQSSVGEIPMSLQYIKAELPLLQDTLQQTREALEAGSVRDQTKKALIPVIEGCTEQIRLLDSILAKLLPTSTDSRLRRGTKAILSLHQEPKVESISKILRYYVGTLTFYYAAISSTLQPLTDAKLTKIRQWLAPPDPTLNYQKALKRRQDKTGLWFLESDEYSAWRTDHASFLWLYGIPGCGKTILSSTILQNILQYCSDDPGKVVAYFYFDFNDTQKQSPELMVRSLVSQLSQQCVKIPSTLEALFSSCENGQRQPSLDYLLEALHGIIQEFPQSYIVLDALDECTDRAELMAILERMAGWKLNESHFLVTSRKERDIESSLESIVDTQHTICLQSELVDRDIFTYVRQRLSDDKSLSKWQKDPGIRREIETSLMKGAHGMFRWAECQLDTLGKCRNRLTLRNSLATLPPTLDETYDRILCAIDKEDSEYAVRILRWLAFSFRPLLVEEIAEVVAIDIERNPIFNSEEVLEDPLEVLSICSSLVIITTTENEERISTTKVVALAHYSVKEYLISERILQSRVARYSLHDIFCHEFIATSCIGYFLQFQETGFLSDEKIEESKLALYTAKYWIKHTQLAAPKAEVLNRLIMELFSTTNGAYLNWTRIFDIEHPWSGPNLDRTLGKVPGPLYQASLSGLIEIVSLLVFEDSANVNAQGGRYGTALTAASEGGHDQIVELLLAKGANVNEQVGYYIGTALKAASEGGHDQIVELLLANGADVNRQEGSYYRTALAAASGEGHNQIVELLLAKGADVNSQGGAYHGTVLAAASSKGHNQIVELLLAKGADVNSQGGTYHGTALMAASGEGHKQIVELLLSKGANVNSQGGRYYGTALAAASEGGHDQVVELLLANGADVNGQGGSYHGTALAAASGRGHKQIVELLLAKGADVNRQGGGSNYGTALAAASGEGYNQIVELLVARGADVNRQGEGSYYGTALEAASGEGHKQIVELLLAKGADVNRKGGGSDYGTALAAASGEGHNQIVELLIAKGADVSGQGGSYFSTALAAASGRGHNQILELLLAKGARSS